MLGVLVLDIVILTALVAILGRGNRRALPRVAGVSLGVAVAYSAAEWLLGWLLGHLLVVPMVIVTGVVLMFFCGLRLRQAAAVSGLFFVLRVVLHAIVERLFCVLGNFF